tara:strand:+ start:63 stop:1070 length:1008 start_codon:yes stop_codon:yes gene_type:complete
MNRIHARSPFFIQSTSGSTATLNLYVWSGSKLNSEPPSPTYVLTKQHQNTKATFEISELIRDYLNNSFSGTYQSAVVNVKATLIDGNGTNDTYYLAVDGYNLWNEANNTVNSEEWLSSSDILRFPETGTLTIPLSNDVTSIDWMNGGVVLKNDILNASGDNSLDNIQYSQYTIGTKPTHVIINSSLGNITKNISYLDCSKYDTAKVTFINKYGVLKDIYLNAKSSENLNVSNKEFKSNSFTYDNIADNNNSHLYSTYNTNGRKLVTLNSGFVSEQINPVYESLFLSENIYLTIDNNIYPVNLESKNFNYKTHLNDKLINYTLNLSYSFDYINNIK